MNYIIVGLGNPGEEYKNTRHNVGRIILENFANANASVFHEWESDKKLKALVSAGKIDKNKITLIEPETFMNNSGKSVLYAKNNNKIKPENIIIIYDDLDLPFGTFRIAFNRGSGGHKGLESIIKTIKTKEFVRIRVGVCPTTPTGKMKKPKGDKKVLDFIMKDFSKKEMDILGKLSKKVNEALVEIIEGGRVSAMNKFN